MSFDVPAHRHLPIEIYGTEGTLVVPDPNWFGGEIEFASAKDKWLKSQLLGFADHTGRSLGKRGMSVIVSDGNLGARRLYERCGYSEIAARTMVKDAWRNEGRNWVLLAKAL